MGSMVGRRRVPFALAPVSRTPLRATRCQTRNDRERGDEFRIRSNALAYSSAECFFTFALPQASGITSTEV
jgi:hypothetical protein